MNTLGRPEMDVRPGAEATGFAFREERRRKLDLKNELRFEETLEQLRDMTIWIRLSRARAKAAGHQGGSMRLRRERLSG